MSRSIAALLGQRTTRRRIAVWLLLAWTTSWLVGVIQPCCFDVIGVANAGERATALTGHGSGEHMPTTPDNGSACEVLAQPSLIAQDLAFALSAPRSLLLAPPPARGAGLSAIAPHRLSLAHHKYRPDTPVFLRTSRLLI